MSGQLIGDLLAIGGKTQEECDRLTVQLQESERLRAEAFQACDAMRLEYEKLRLERDEWKAAAEYQQQQATQLRQQVAALEASLEQGQGVNKTLAGQLADKQRQSQVLMKERDDRTAQLQSAIQQVAELQAQLDAAKNEASKTGWVVVGSHLPNREQLDAEIVRLTGNWGREIDERKALQQQVAELQAQLEAAAVTPAQQPDDNAAEQLERVRRLIGEICGWYVCADWLSDRERTTAWEQAGALLGHLQGEAE